MLTIVIEKTRSFDRRIAVRNTIECMAAGLVVVLFGWLAWQAPSTLERAGMAMVAASGLWIAYYILRFGAGPKRLDLGVNLAAYRQLLTENYDRQIRLLRNVKYWYLLPPYLGILLSTAGAWLRRRPESANSWVVVASLGIVTAIFALVWMANEKIGVRYIERLKRELKTIDGRDL